MRTYSSITAGKFPSEVNYAGRVFQLDIVFLPWHRNVGGVIVREKNLIPVLTCVCVASRYALVKRLESTKHDHVSNMMKAHVLPVIYDKLDEIMRLDGPSDCWRSVQRLHLNPYEPLFPSIRERRRFGPHAVRAIAERLLEP